MANVDRHSARRGVTTVEAAIVFPLLILLTLGLIEYGWIFLRAQQTTNAARQGARLAATPDATSPEVLAAIEQYMSDADMSDTGYTVEITPGDITSASTGDPLTVAVAVPCESVRLTEFRLPMPNELRASVTMAKEGP